LNGDKTEWIYADLSNVTPKFQRNGVWKDTVERNTGLTDKNKKAIFTGNIVVCDFEKRGICVVGFSLNNQRTMLYRNANCDIPVCDLDHLTAQFCEIIGDVHESTKLLNNCATCKYETSDEKDYKEELKEIPICADCYFQMCEDSNIKFPRWESKLENK